MSTKTIEFVENGQYILKPNNKLSTDVENEAIEKEIAVENVIRRLRQKKSLEVKKVDDMDSKLMQISPLRDKKSESKEFNQPKPAVIDLDSYQNIHFKSEVDRQNVQSVHKANSLKISNFMEIEDDEIEDYLEIDQNVVKDLEALIPEEEIVSISKSMIQPEDQLSTEAPASTTIPETKYENVEIPEESREGPSVSLNIPSDAKHDSKYEEIEMKIKHEDKVQINDGDIVSIDSPSKENTVLGQKNSSETKIINNNELDSQTNVETTPLSSISMEISEALVGEIGNPKLQTTLKPNKTQLKKSDSRNNKKLKLNPNSLKNLRRITDFLVPSSIKIADFNEQKTKIDENFLNVKNASNEIINLDKEELPVETRTLRSRSKLYLNESKTRESRATDEILTRSSKEKLHFPKTLSVVEVKDDEINDPIDEQSKIKKVTTICLVDDSETKTETEGQPEKDAFCNVDEIEMKNEESDVIEEPNTHIQNTNELNYESSKSSLVKEITITNRGNQDSSLETSSELVVESKAINDISKDEQKQILEKEAPSNLHENVSVITNNNKTEVNISPETTIVLEIKNETKDRNENHVYTESSAQEEQVDIIESQQINENQRKGRNTNQRKKKLVSHVQEQQMVEIAPDDINNEKVGKIQRRSKSRTNNNQEGKQKTRKKQSRNRNHKKVSKQKGGFDNLDNSSTETVDKNNETKLEIYDFDDKSNEEIELLKKSSKKRKNVVSKSNKTKQQNLEETPIAKRPKLEDVDNIEKQNPQTNSKTSENTPLQHVEAENINNNKVNTLQDNIKSIVQSSDIQHVVPGDSQTELKDDKIKVDSNISNSNIVQKEGEEGYGQNWKPVYGPYKRIDRCNVCLIAFKNYKKLRAHKKIHEVENPYKCSKCDQSFEDVEQLAAHLRIHKGYDEEMNLSELESDVDVPDVKPIDVSLVNIQSKADSKKEKFPVSNELACESNEVSSTTSRINDEPNEGRRRKSSRNCNKGTSLKVAEVKKKLTRSIEKEADNKLTRIQRKKTRSGLKEELKKEPFEDCDDSFLECYSVPVEDQDEYSEIVHDQDEYSEAVNEEFQLSSLVECDSGEVVVEDQDEYSQIENENSELSSLMEYERDEMEVEDQDEYSQISHEGSEISLIEYEKETEESDNSQNRFEFENTDTHIGVMNEMAEAEYMLETNTTISSSPKKKRISRRKKKKPSKGLKATEPKIIKVKRDNLPPLILKSVRKKTLLLGKMPFACKKCDATFWTSFQLDKHQLVHVLKKVPAPSKPPSKVFKCEECGKEFKKICDLERHTRVHTGEKPSVCNICNKRFQQAYNLNKHLYTHTQEKNFECVICQKKFGRNDVLNRHVLTHSIVKPFRCSLCSKTFIRNSQLKLHLQKRHGLDEDPGSGASAVDDPVASTSATKS